MIKLYYFSTQETLHPEFWKVAAHILASISPVFKIDI